MHHDRNFSHSIFSHLCFADLTFVKSHFTVFNNLSIFRFWWSKACTFKKLFIFNFNFVQFISLNLPTPIPQTSYPRSFYMYNLFSELFFIIYFLLSQSKLEAWYSCCLYVNCIFIFPHFILFKFMLNPVSWFDTVLFFSFV